ncbi:hypothetical protein ACFQ3Z_07730 [Streptomyces nogalater]
MGPLGVPQGGEVVENGSLKDLGVQRVGAGLIGIADVVQMPVEIVTEVLVVEVAGDLVSREVAGLGVYVAAEEALGLCVLLLVHSVRGIWTLEKGISGMSM